MTHVYMNVRERERERDCRSSLSKIYVNPFKYPLMYTIIKSNYVIFMYKDSAEKILFSSQSLHRSKYVS